MFDVIPPLIKVKGIRNLLLAMRKKKKKEKEKKSSFNSLKCDTRALK